MRPYLALLDVIAIVECGEFTIPLDGFQMFHNQNFKTKGGVNIYLRTSTVTLEFPAFVFNDPMVDTENIVMLKLTFKGRSVWLVVAYNRVGRKGRHAWMKSVLCALRNADCLIVGDGNKGIISLDLKHEFNISSVSVTQRKKNQRSQKSF